MKCVLRNREQEVVGSLAFCKARENGVPDKHENASFSRKDVQELAGVLSMKVVRGRRYIWTFTVATP